MGILEKLFELHFHSPAERVQPIQGQLGGSGRQIVRLANNRFSAIGIHHGVREEFGAHEQRAIGRNLEAKYQWEQVLSLKPDSDLVTTIETKLKSGLADSPETKAANRTGALAPGQKVAE